jgi:hypothetical protein
MQKKFTFLFLTFSIITSSIIAQLNPVDVAENTLKVSGFGEEIFYYGFAEGDQLIFNFQEVNGKELKELEIIELPTSSKFMDYKTKKIENKTINITKTGIYKFRFSNSAVGGRICRFKIQRIPANETTKNFNSSVLWRTVYDSTKYVVKENYLVKKEYKPVQLLEPSQFYINSGSNATFKGGKSRITLPVILPRNTVEWYYVFSASRDEDEISRTKKSINLMGQMTKLIDQSGVLNIGVDMFTKPPGGNVCDIYLLDVNNRNPFEEKVECRHYPEGTRENITSGVVKIKSALFLNNYLGIKNPDGSYGIYIAIEAVAITLEEEWGVKDVTKYTVTTRQEAYLNN